MKQAYKYHKVKNITISHNNNDEAAGISRIEITSVCPDGEIIAIFTSGGVPEYRLHRNGKMHQISKEENEKLMWKWSMVEKIHERINELATCSYADIFEPIPGLEKVMEFLNEHVTS